MYNLSSRLLSHMLITHRSNPTYAWPRLMVKAAVMQCDYQFIGEQIWFRNNNDLFHFEISVKNDWCSWSGRNLKNDKDQCTLGFGYRDPIYSSERFFK